MHCGEAEAPQLIDSSEHNDEKKIIFTRDGQNPHASDMMALDQILWNCGTGARAI
jgi:hypothetical protein